MSVAINWRAFSNEISSRLVFGDTIRQKAREIGVPHWQLRRALGGEVIGLEDMIRICRWLGKPVEDFTTTEPENAQS